jgi:hypothetical protein
LNHYYFITSIPGSCFTSNKRSYQIQEKFEDEASPKILGEVYDLSFALKITHLLNTLLLENREFKK